MSNKFEKPFDLLNEFCGEPVDIYRRDGSVVRGTLHSYDHHVNLALTDVTTYPEGVDAQVQETEDKFFQRGGDVVDVRPSRD